MNFMVQIYEIFSPNAIGAQQIVNRLWITVDQIIDQRFLIFNGLIFAKLILGMFGWIDTR